MTILSTPLCTLRPFTEEDAENLIPILGSEAVMRYSMTGVMDLPAISNTINGWIALYESHGFGPWAVIHQGQLIGYAGLDSRVVEEIAQVQITFRLAESCWGKGFATELALSIRDYAFHHLKLPSLIAIVDPENLASIHTISKMGMRLDKAVIYGGLSLHVYKITAPNKIFLETARCTLRPFTLNDVDALYRLHSHPVVMQHIPRGTRTREEILEDIQEDIVHQEQYGFSKWAVFSKESGEFIGRAGWAWLKDEVEAGYKFFPEYWGKGYATEILKALLSWGKATISAPLVAFTYPDNIASIRVMEKAGMIFLRNDTYEGKSVVVYGYNKMHDDELDIDESLVSKLLGSQFSKLVNLPIKRLTHSGTDHAIFRLGDEYALRLPRVSSAEEQMVKEQEWLPKLGSLPLATPNPIANGKPSNDYPYHWYVYRWIKGVNAY